MGSWQGTQRKLLFGQKKSIEIKDAKIRKYITLTDEILDLRKEKLEKIGFISISLTEAWNEGYLETVKYKKKTGNANCLKIHVTESGLKLGQWQGNQKKRKKAIN